MRAKVAAIAIGVSLLTAPVVAAAPAGAGDFGRHVAHCAHEMGGFSGSHNPGMHHGASGWDHSGC
jgi:hypothetical protein